MMVQVVEGSAIRQQEPCSGKLPGTLRNQDWRQRNLGPPAAAESKAPRGSAPARAGSGQLPNSVFLPVSCQPCTIKSSSIHQEALQKD